MRSKIYTGTIEHHRYHPVTHDLSYPVYMYAFELDELNELDNRYPFFGYNRTGMATIRDKDYLEPGNIPIRQKITRLLKQHHIGTPVSSVLTITSARYLNYIFNPVNFHYCYSADQHFAAIIAEVNNTYGDRHPYVLTNPEEISDQGLMMFKTPKVFHVSPFNTIEGTYVFYFSVPGDRIEIRIELIQNNQKIMAAAFRAAARPMTGYNQFKTILRYPITPHLNIPRIYAHAFKLFFQKKLSFHDRPVPQSPLTLKKQTPSMVEAVCRQIFLHALRRVSFGCLKLEMPNGQSQYFGDRTDEQIAVLQIRDYHFFSRIIFDGEIGLGEAYMHSEWDTPDLAAVLRFLVTNRDQLSDGNLVLSLLTRIQEKFAHDRKKNTIENTPGNIAAHYDLSNDFYSLFLDERMLYSCGIFTKPDDTLEAAQEAKMKRILAQADIRKNHHILEIGCGWGGFAVFAVKETGCRVTGITVSKAQYDKACQRVKDEGLEDRITILLQDYRRTIGQFDRIVSIEMIEAVGPQFRAAYSRQCRDLLTPSGKMVFQAIIIEDDRYEKYCKERDWIQKHIFPGGHLPSLRILKEIISSETDLHVEDVHHMGGHYATTLARWRERFNRHIEKISAMGFDETFLRKWVYYFSICEAGFITGGIDDIQVTLTRAMP